MHPLTREMLAPIRRQASGGHHARCPAAPLAAGGPRPDFLLPRDQDHSVLHHAYLLLTMLGGAIDTYPRQPVDVEHYRFALTLTDSTDRIEGKPRYACGCSRRPHPRGTRPRRTSPRRDRGRGMVVRAVSSGGVPLAFTHLGDRLAMTLARSVSAGAGRRVRGALRPASPPTGCSSSLTAHGDRTFFSDDWPDKARQWLPTIDHISDKATMEMDVVAPAHYQVISNGRRMEETDLSDGMRRTVWRESVPIAPWLYVLGVARFAVQHVGDYNGKPLETWVFHKDRDAGFHDFAVPVKEAMAFYSGVHRPLLVREARQRAVQLGERRDGGRLGHLLQRRERDRDAKCAVAQRDHPRDCAPMVGERRHREGLERRLVERGLRHVLHPALHRARVSDATSSCTGCATHARR
jgi:hypothetical protein